MNSAPLPGAASVPDVQTAIVAPKALIAITLRVYPCPVDPASGQPVNTETVIAVVTRRSHQSGRPAAPRRRSSLSLHRRLHRWYRHTLIGQA
ncbi:hypothetical protein ACUN9Y_14970 [Halomonas sp. V046]|uniref:hypothetical protein n=1 Tax=Halomonas sp. V046 TaxID=3459611 RepID=UPI0040444C47